MKTEEIFVSGVRSAGDLAGVFGHDEDTGYFYLYDITSEAGQKIVDSIWITGATPDFQQADVTIGWDGTESKVGLFIRGQLWAVFDTHAKTKFGGGYLSHGRAEIPEAIAAAFSTH